MRVAPTADEVHELVVQTFREFGADREQLADLSDTILIQEGHYYGRSYRLDDMMAMWMRDVGIVQFYGADGEMLRTVNLLRELRVVQRAA